MKSRLRSDETRDADGEVNVPAVIFLLNNDRNIELSNEKTNEWVKQIIVINMSLSYICLSFVE